MFTQHMLSLSEHFEIYFPEDLEQYDWVRNPSQSSTPSTLSTEEEEQRIEYYKANFKNLSNGLLWIYQIFRIHRVSAQ